MNERDPSLILTENHLRSALEAGEDLSCGWSQITIVIRGYLEATLRDIISSYGYKAKITYSGEHGTHKGYHEFKAEFEPRK